VFRVEKIFHHTEIDDEYDQRNDWKCIRYLSESLLTKTSEEYAIAYESHQGMNIIQGIITLQPIWEIAFEICDDIASQVNSKGEEEICNNRFHVTRLTTKYEIAGDRHECRPYLRPVKQ
jgi:hypothetical protein